MKEEWKLVLCQECSLALNLHSKLGVEHMKKGTRSKVPRTHSVCLPVFAVGEAAGWDGVHGL